MGDEAARHWNSNEHYLFLLRPSHKDFISSQKGGNEFELFPVATERRYTDQARQFIETSLCSAFSASPGFGRNQKSSVVDLSEMLKRQPPLQTSNNSPSTTVSPGQISTMNGGFQFPVLETEDYDTSRSKFPKTNAKVKSSYVLHQGLPAPFSPYPDSEEFWLPLIYDPEESLGEILLPSVYDPNEGATINTPKDCSKANGLLSNMYADIDMDVPFGIVSGIDDIGFESMIRDGSMTDQILDELVNGYGSSINGISRHSESITVMKTVNAHQANYSQARPEVQSVYADIYASNPFDVDFSTCNDIDSSIRATLFPPKTSTTLDLSSIEDMTPPETPGSSFAGSTSSQSNEGDMAIMINDFHRALSSIVKERPQPPAFGLSAKAMSLLGQTEGLIDVKPCNKVLNSTKKQSSPVDSSTNRKDTLPRKASEGFTIKDRNPLGRPTKLQSILGISIPSLTTNFSSSVSDSSKNGPRTNSSLFEKLYCQVLKPSDTCYSGDYASNAKHEGDEPHRVSDLGRFDGEPIKRTSLSSSNESPAHRMPFSSSGSTNYDQITRQRSGGKIRLSSSKATNNQTGSTQTQSNVDTPQRSFQDTAKIPNKFLGELMGKSNDSTHARSISLTRRTYHDKTERNSSQIGREDISVGYRPASNGSDRTHTDSETFSIASPYQQFQCLASASESISNTANFDQGLPFKRPKSPVKKMFSNTVEKISRIIPIGNDMKSAHETSINSSSELKISIHPADQNRLFGDLEYIIQDTANRFLLYQHSHSRLSPQSIEKTARDWRQKNRPQVAQFLYPISVQRKLVEQNLNTITFHGPLAGNATAINAIMHTWKYVAQELAIRSFCLPDAGLQHFLREAARLLELLGVTAGHMLHFQAWNNTVCQTVHANYQTPYSLHH